jgi:hypothetical protein
MGAYRISTTVSHYSTTSLKKMCLPLGFIAHYALRTGKFLAATDCSDESKAMRYQQANDLFDLAASKYEKKKAASGRACAHGAVQREMA